MARTKDIVAIGTPIAFVVVAALLGMRRPPEKKPKPDKILVVCSYESDDDSALAFVVSGRDCAACRRHPLYAKVASSDSELVGCYRQVQKGEDDELSQGAEGEPRWSEAEKEARRCDGLSPRNACVDLKTLSFACRRECHRDPDCVSLCRSRCDTTRCGTMHKVERVRGEGGHAVASVR